MLSSGTRINANVTNLFISVLFVGLLVKLVLHAANVVIIFSTSHIEIPTFIGENP